MKIKFKDFLLEHKLHKNQYQLLDYIEKLSLIKTFVFVDTESTGLGGHKHQQLTQISAIAYNYDYKNNKFKKLTTFNKKIKISPDVRKRLYDKNRKYKPIIPGTMDITKVFKFNRYGDKIPYDTKYYDEIQIINEFKNWLSNLEYEPLLIMQNASFDMDLLVGRSGEKLLNNNNNKPYEIIDTKQLLQLFIIPIFSKLSENDIKYKEILNKIGTSSRDKGLTTSAMGKWAPYFDIDLSGYHDALTDCEITSKMFSKIIEIIKEHSDLNINKYQADIIIKNKK